MRRSPGSASRFARRQWGRRWRAVRPILLSVLAAGLLGFVGWALLLSSWLAVDRVQVRGEQHLSNGTVLAAADITVGTPLLRVDLGEVGDRVGALAPVESVSVHRSWPHTLTITVTERKPLAAVHRADGWWVIDKQGVVFRRTGERAATLPVIETRPGTDAPALLEATKVLTELPADVVHSVRALRARSMDSITLAFRDGRDVVWGSAAESARKVEVLKVLLKHPARTYDVSVPEQPTTSG